MPTADGLKDALDHLRAVVAGEVVMDEEERLRLQQEQVAQLTGVPLEVETATSWLMLTYVLVLLRSTPSTSLFQSSHLTRR